ncbi:FKBP-type peptidyl-prolyl cis-trans isomerase [Sphingomonas crusticola]|uniref:FKBP-type peptidyl-prolyl cis-trans isomerase n=1 Tax=Sphingomonas crusticola TaxID=1697973 RepID=UPI000E26F759|nr:FKBP-type peptidyl-prolyl cis-trans isomerase [Sphingomonas crusticola]
MSDITAVPLRPVGKSGVTALWAGVALLLAAGIGGGVYASTAARRAAVASPAMAKLSAPDFLAANGKRRGVRTTASGVEYLVIKPGSGPTPTAADIALIDYRGTLTDGTVFDLTKPGEPAQLPVGQVVPGFAEAMMLMRKGSQYRVWLPPQLAYGDRQAGTIPPGSVLVFDITMHDFAPMPSGMPGQQPGM